MDTLAQMAASPRDLLGHALKDLALTDEQLAELTIPLSYVACRRDEIIPGSEVAQLRDFVPHLSVLEYDDSHGAPKHVAETQLWTIREILRMRGVRNLKSAAVGLLWRLKRSRKGGS
jgi:hypothetical protein